MASLRKQIVDAVILALNTSRPAGVPAASRLRQSQFEKAEGKSISVYPGDEPTAPATNRPSPLTKRQLTIAVECRVVGDEPDVLLDPLTSWAESAICNAMSALWHDEPQLTLTHHEYTIGAQCHGLARLSFVIQYQTRRGNPEAAA
jgi:hypothetical protein